MAVYMLSVLLWSALACQAMHVSQGGVNHTASLLQSNGPAAAPEASGPYWGKITPEGHKFIKDALKLLKSVPHTYTIRSSHGYAFHVKALQSGFKPTDLNSCSDYADHFVQFCHTTLPWMGIHPNGATAPASAGEVNLNQAEVDEHQLDMEKFSKAHGLEELEPQKMFTVAGLEGVVPKITPDLWYPLKEEWYKCEKAMNLAGIAFVKPKADKELWSSQSTIPNIGELPVPPFL